MFFDYDLCRKWQTGKDAKNRINFDNDENSIDMWKKELNCGKKEQNCNFN